MRIVHLIPTLNFGGLQEVVRGLVLCLKERGHQVAIVTWSSEGNNPEAERELEKAGVTVARIPWSEDRRIASFRDLRSYLKTEPCDILHVHNPFNYYLYGAVAARSAGVPKIIETLHATEMFNWLRIRDKMWFLAAAMLSDRVVSVCAELEAEVCRRFPLPASKLAVVDNGINLSRFVGVPTRVPREEVVFGTVGRMVDVKNFRLLVEAFALARRKYGNIRLRFLGGGPLEKSLQQRVHELDLNDCVHFHGYSHDVPGFLASLDVFVLCSNSEGLPLSLLEAIASGLPVVATEVGGVPGVVQRSDSGWLCPPRNPEALMTAMEFAICSPERRERGERARRFVAERYSVARMTSDYEKVYESLFHD